MPVITDASPPNVQADLDALAAALDTQIPAKANDNLLIATWNIRSFGSLTREWTAAGSDKPKRDLRGLRAIIEILSRFDVIAIQELTGNLRALRDTMRFLGDDWSFLMTDVTLGDEGRSERMAYMFDRTRVQPSGLAAELVVPPERLDRMEEHALREQFARTPYAVSFKRNSATFILASLHIILATRQMIVFLNFWKSPTSFATGLDAVIVGITICCAWVTSISIVKVTPCLMRSLARASPFQTYS